MILFEMVEAAQPALTSEQQIQLGSEAEGMLESEVFRLAMGAAEMNLLQVWLNAEDVARRETMWAVIHGLGEVRNQLRIIASDGEVARNRLKVLTEDQ